MEKSSFKESFLEVLKWIAIVLTILVAGLGGMTLIWYWVCFIFKT